MKELTRCRHLDAEDGPTFPHLVCVNRITGVESTTGNLRDHPELRRYIGTSDDTAHGPWMECPGVAGQEPTITRKEFEIPKPGLA